MPSKWALTCTVPKHPKYCPDCKARGKTSRVRIYHLNMEKDAIFMCEDTQVGTLSSKKNFFMFNTNVSFSNSCPMDRVKHIFCHPQTCVWPLMTHSPEDILGKSDYKEFARMKLEKKKVKKLKQAERKSSGTD